MRLGTRRLRATYSTTYKDGKAWDRKTETSFKSLVLVSDKKGKFVVCQFLPREWKRFVGCDHRVGIEWPSRVQSVLRKWLEYVYLIKFYNRESLIYLLHLTQLYSVQSFCSKY